MLSWSLSVLWASPEFILNDQIPPATSLKPIPADAVEFTLQPETTTTTTTIVDIIPNLLHESSEEAEEVVSLHAHEILEDYYDELDQTTESGATYLYIYT